MRVLLTGASSFTGFWFARELANAGHEVVATFRRRPEDYDDLRRRRVAMVLDCCRGVFGCAFGGEQFLDLVRREAWDLFCHHAADATDYRSPGFDVTSALANNTRNVAAVVAALKAGSTGCPRLIVTGSVFENDEGAGSEELPAFSPYGLSKSFTFQVFRYHALRAGFSVGKVVIPNPFGPFEEPRFTTYLAKTWFARQPALVNSPAYVRDNIHASLLARVYAKFAAGLPARPGLLRLRPSGYPESQGAFTLRFASQMRERLGLACEVRLLAQTAFPEPRVRINTDPPDALALGWDEASAWDELAAYYRETFAS